MGPVRPLSESIPPRCHHGAEEPDFCDAELIAGLPARKEELSRRLTSETVFCDIRHTLGIGFVPDLFEGMREKPAYMATAWELFREDLQLDQLDHRTKQMIALAVSTDAAGNYFITEYPHAFRLNALDKAICDKIVLTIRFFHAFDRYMSGVMPHSIPDTSAFLTDCLRDEYHNFEETSAGILMSSRNYHAPFPPYWRRSIPIWGPLILSIAVVSYLCLH